MNINGDTITLWGNEELCDLRKHFKDKFLEKCKYEFGSNYLCPRKCFDDDKIFKGRIDVFPLHYSLWVEFFDNYYLNNSKKTEFCFEHSRMVQLRIPNRKEYFDLYKYICECASKEAVWFKNKNRMVKDYKEKEEREKMKTEMMFDWEMSKKMEILKKEEINKLGDKLVNLKL